MNDREKPVWVADIECLKTQLREHEPRYSDVAIAGLTRNGVKNILALHARVEELERSYRETVDLCSTINDAASDWLCRMAKLDRSRASAVG